MKTFQEVMADYEIRSQKEKEKKPKKRKLPKDQGYIYIASNPTMPYIVKVGITRQSPEVRVKALGASTNMPTPFHLEYARLVLYPRKVEAAVHQKLREYRVNKKREFFRCKPEEAQLAIDSLSVRIMWDEGYCNINKKLLKNA